MLSILTLQALVSSVPALSLTRKDHSLPMPNENFIELANN